MTESVIQDVKAHSVSQSPLLWVVRSRETEPFSYTLVVIGDPDLITGLVLSETVTISQVFQSRLNDISSATMEACPDRRTKLPIFEALGVNGFGQPQKLESVSLRLEVASPGGGYFPVKIDYIDYQPLVVLAERCHNFPTIALNRPADVGPGLHQLMLYIDPEGTAGIPGQTRTLACLRWESGRWWQRVLRQIHC